MSSWSVVSENLKAVSLDVWLKNILGLFDSLREEQLEVPLEVIVDQGVNLVKAVELGLDLKARQSCWFNHNLYLL